VHRFCPNGHSIVFILGAQRRSTQSCHVPLGILCFGLNRVARDSFECFACARQGQVPTLFGGALLGASVSGVVYPVTVFRFGVVRIHVFRCVCPVCLQSKRESEERERETEKERERASESERDTAFRCSMLILAASVSYHVTHMRNIWWWCCVQMCPTILISSRTRWTWAQFKNA